MQTYGEFQPTGFDPKGLGLPDQQHWLVAPVSITRDSGCLEQSNFQTALEILGGESEVVEVHRFGHWGPGWFEIIIVDPADSKLVGQLEDIERRLADYPVLDESDWSDREFNQACEYWESMSVSMRVEAISEHARGGEYGCNIFAARRDELPSDDGLYEYLTTE